MKTVKQGTPEPGKLAMCVMLAAYAIGLTDGRELRKDHSGEISSFVVGLVSILVLIIIVAALIPTIVTNIYSANSSLNSGQRALLGIVPLLVIVALVLSVVFWALAHHKAS